jgi:hypothetical protein
MTMEILTQPNASGIAIVTGLVIALFALIVFLAVRRRRRRGLTVAEADLARAEPAVPSGLDVAALTAAVSEAQSSGQLRRLPGLYLSLARWHAEAGDIPGAEDLLRKSIRGATEAGMGETHARARVALGDIALTAGDRATACEHWQIARGLFYDLKKTREHEDVEGRMLKNGCPTDWVLTDF